MTALGIIGGSGFNQLPDFKISNKIEVQTPYGVPSSAVVSGKFGGIDVLFLARHGESHTIAPHRINYRANMTVHSHPGPDNRLYLGQGTHCLR
jgi:purine nucleoside phosphorylase